MKHFMFMLILSSFAVGQAVVKGQSTLKGQVSVKLQQNVAPPQQTITGVALANDTFTTSTSLATVGSIQVAMNPSAPAFSGSLSLSGTDAVHFSVAGNYLQAIANTAAGTYHLNIIATQAGAIGSPFTQAITIIGNDQAAECGQAGIHCAENCSRDAVAAAITAAQVPSPGQPADTVILPACPNTTPGTPDNASGNTWAGVVGFGGKRINFIGQGMDQTVLIQKNPEGAGNSFIYIGTPINDTGPMRISGFTYQEESRNRTGSASAFPLEIHTASRTLHVDHIRFAKLGTHLPYTPGVHGIYIGDSEWGLVDHVIWEGDAAGQANTRHSKWLGLGDYSDYSWHYPSTMGTEQAIFFEDNFDLIRASNSLPYSCDVGARCVWRHNVWPFFGSHGTDSTNRYRGVRQFEIYENQFQCNTNGSTPYPLNPAQNMTVSFIGVFRGGTGMLWGNTTYLTQRTVNLPNGGTFTSPASTCYGGTVGPGPPQFFVYRTIELGGGTPGFGFCSGYSPWDNNDPHGIYDSGTMTGTGGATGPVTNKNTIIDSNKDWVPNQWTGYLVRNVGVAYNGTNAPGLAASFILSNTSNTLTTYPAGNGGWGVDQAYEIRRVYDCMDSQGRGQSALVQQVGGANVCQAPHQPGFLSCVNVPNSTSTSWVNNKTEPLYAWNNAKVTSSGTYPYCSSGSGCGAPAGSYFAGQGTWAGPNSPLAVNRDAYEEQGSGAPFNGTVGMGVGPVASRPPTCTPNPRWASGGPGIPGVGWWDPTLRQLSVCTAPNVWTEDYYHPYVYPHPLQAQALFDRAHHVIETGDGHVRVDMKKGKHVHAKPNKQGKHEY